MEGQSNSKTAVVSSLKAAKRNSGKTYGQIAAETGLTNVYVAQLFKRQAQLSPENAPKLRSALPQLPEELLQEMMQPPWRSYDPNLIQEPTVYRLNEAVMHFGESIKEIINEEFGDGILAVHVINRDFLDILANNLTSCQMLSDPFQDQDEWNHKFPSIPFMSAIDFYCSVDKVKGVDGKDRVVLTFDGKYLPYTEQPKGRGLPEGLLKTGWVATGSFGQKRVVGGEWAEGGDGKEEGGPSKEMGGGLVGYRVAKGGRVRGEWSWGRLETMKTCF
ncbi:hypothetical protein RHMOL_Rhmol02G0047300 [Rhododendron molle]|uniref:Uncharacterized protein n=1 Tax=Rhododendron molle TaxID=49168 RepID=A0ACC0PLH1_RHOML|nr:hypothetical protein RHMOL_Rhmol02G0047300 [Rhododendron molle]